MHHSLRPRIDDQRLKRGRRFWINRFTSTFRALPSFLIIGEMKSGTSSLFYYLQRHPRVMPPIRKEIHFFSIGYQKGCGWYRSHFPLRRSLPEGFITGEGCPDYLFAPGADERIHRLLPKARLVVLLRNPIERAISHYFHEVKMGREYLPILEALQAEDERLSRARISVNDGLETYLHASYKRRGCYAESLERYFSLFPREQVLVVCSEQFVRNPKSTMNSVIDFFGLDKNVVCENFRLKNPGHKSDIGDNIVNHLKEYFAPHNDRLFKLLGYQLEW